MCSPVWAIARKACTARAPARFWTCCSASTSFSEFATNWDLLNKVNDNDAELVQRNKDLRTEAQEQKATFDEQSRTAAAKASEAKQIQTRLSHR